MPSNKPAAASRRTYVRPRTGWQAIDFAELWRSRDLLGMFAIRDVKVRYKQTFFGYAWAVVVPIVQVVVFTFIFGNVLGVSDKVSETYGRVIPYAMFVLTGQVAWNFFKGVIDGSGGSLLNNAGIIRKIYVPRLILPLSAVAKPAVDAAVVYVLMLIGAIWLSTGDNDIRIAPTILLSPLLLAGVAIPGLAIGLFAASITVSYRDLVHVLPFAVGILFYLTPVLLPVQLLPDAWQWLLLLNPTTGFVESLRASVLGLPMPWMSLLISFVFSTLLLVAGCFFFARSERAFADLS
jgi:lipopolysaccharide transport system permease protein